MAVPKVLLYYAFAELSDTEAVKLWQKTLCDALGLRGRIVIAPQGINGTLGGELTALKKYVRATKLYAGFKHTDFKWSEGTLNPDGTSADFPRLSVKVRPELVNFGAPDAITIEGGRITNGGRHLAPHELHELVAEKDVVFFDGRNRVEAEIGHFRDAITPDVSTTREFIDVLDSGAYDDLKDKPVVTYCTGGIRCEILTPLMKQRGFQEVYQLDGGIARYGEAFGDDGLWEGSMYVFDGRQQLTFSDHTAVVGRCDSCKEPSSDVVDCREPSCITQFVRCAECTDADHHCAKHTTAQPV